MIKLLQDMRINPDDILVNFDVTSLFSNILTKEAMEIITESHKVLKHVLTLATHCLTNAYFTYGQEMYKQEEETPMD